MSAMLPSAHPEHASTVSQGCIVGRTVTGRFPVIRSWARTPTFVREIHVTPARWKKVAGVLQKTGMDCRDGRNTKRTDPLNVRSVNEMREDSVQIPSGSLSLLILLGPEFRPPQLCCL